MKTSTAVVMSVVLGVGIGTGVAYLRTEVLCPWYNRPVRSESGQAATKPAAKLVLEGEPTHNFGVLEAGSDGSHVFVIRNAGSAPLTIKQGISTCKCTITALGNDTDAKNDDKHVELAPGESTQVTIEWHTKDQNGPFEQTATFETNDPEQKKLVLKIQGRILEPYIAEPRELVFSSIPCGEPAQADIEVRSFRRVPFEKIRTAWSATDTAQFFEISDEPMSAADVKKDPQAISGRRLHVRVKPGLPSGLFQQKIVLTIEEGADSPQVEIPVRGTITGELSVVGAGWQEALQGVSLGAVRQDAGKEMTLQIVARGPSRKDVKLEIQKVQPDQLQVSVGEATEVSGGQVIQIPLTIRIPKGAHLGSFMGPNEEHLGQILLKTHCPSTPELRIWVRFAVVN